MTHRLTQTQQRAEPCRNEPTRSGPARAAAARPAVLAALLLVSLAGCTDTPAPGNTGEPEDTTEALERPTILLIDAAGDVSRMMRLNPGDTQAEVIRPRLAESARGLTLDRSEGILYWAAREGDRIQLGRWNDASVSDLPIAGLDSAYAVEYLAEEDALYWSDYGTDAIHRLPLGGGDIDVVVDGLTAPRQIAIDPGTETLYWVDRGAGTVQSAALGGGGITTIADGFSAPYGITLHPTEDALLVGDAEEGIIYRIELPSGDVSTWLGQAGTHPSFLAIDSAAATLYWTDNRDNVLRRRSLDGGPTKIIAEGFEGPRGLVLVR